MSKENEKPYIGQPMKDIEEQKKVYENKYSKLNVHQKVLLVRRTLSYIQKDTEGYGYKYTKESTILSAIKPMMDEVGLNIEMDTIQAEDVKVSVYVPKEKKYIEVLGIRMHFAFTITNVDKPEDKITVRKIVQDAGSDIKTIGGLETYGNRYFLTKFFLIPNDVLDPDKFDKMVETATAKLLTSDQLKELKELVDSDLTAGKMINSQFGYQKFSDITQNRFNAVIEMVKMYNLKKEMDGDNENI